ncbi:MAG: hypothetical protein AAGA56_07505, partial [Myxococcota bacterium]
RGEAIADASLTALPSTHHSSAALRVYSIFFLALLMEGGCHLVAGFDEYDFDLLRQGGDGGGGGAVEMEPCSTDPACETCLRGTAATLGSTDCCMQVEACLVSESCLEELACFSADGDADACLTTSISRDVFGCLLDCSSECSGAD